MVDLENVDDRDGTSSEPDLSDDSFGLDPTLTPEQIERIQNEAIEADNQVPGVVAAAPDGEAPASNKKKRNREKKTSIYWKHFTQGKTRDDGFYDATCMYCGKVYDMGNQRGTGSLKNHVNKSCKKIPHSVRHKPDALQRMLQSGSATAPALAIWAFDQMKCRKGLARMVIAHDYPFNCVSHHFLKEFLRELQPEFKVPTRNTLRSDCLNVYYEEKELLYDIFGNNSCRFSFTSDLWSNKGRDRGFMALTCHYIDNSWKLRKRVISFSPLPSPHTGKCISDAIYERFVLWNLDKRVLCLVLDSCSANDACIKEMLSGTPIKSELPVLDMGVGMYAKWDKYWSSGNMLLAIACVLDPRSKLGVVEYYMKQMYPESYGTFMNNLNNCMLALFKYYEEEASSRQSASSSQQAAGSSQQHKSTGSASSRVISDTRAGLRDFMRGKKSTYEPQKSELEEYLGEALDETCLESEFDILSWWKLKVAKYPIMARLTRDILAVPISTVASESTFSVSGRTLSPVRSSLSDESLEALICTQDWLKASVNENGGNFGDCLWSTDEA